MTRLTYPLSLVLLGVLTGLGGTLYLGRHASAPPRELTVQTLEPLSALVALRVSVADVCQTRLDGQLGGISAALLVRGDALLGTDLTRARFESVDRERRTAVLILAAPRLSSPRVDLQRSRLVTVAEHGLWRAMPTERVRTEVLNRAYGHAQETVARAAEQPEPLRQCRRQAEAVLHGFFTEIGWDVAIRWSDPTPQTAE